MQKENARALLQQMLGPGTEFRDGQWEAIDRAANRRERVLVVQRTGWGKSIVYFLAAKILRDAGIRWLALGIESGSAHVRDGAEKSLDQQDIVDIVKAIQRAGIHVIGNYIFGLPDDNFDTMQQTLELAKLLNCEFANFYSAMAYPGSPLYRIAIQNGWKLPEAWSGFSQHSYDCKPLPTEQVSSADVLRFRDEAFHQYFENPGYLHLVQKKFGEETMQHIREMTSKRLRRKLLEEPPGPPLAEVAVT